MSEVLERLRERLGDGLLTDDAVHGAHRRDTWMLGKLAVAHLASPASRRSGRRSPSRVRFPARRGH